MEKEKLEQLLWELLFKDNGGHPYEDECSQNRIVRKFAKKYGLIPTKHKQLKRQPDLFDPIFE